MLSHVRCRSLLYRCHLVDTQTKLQSKHKISVSIVDGRRKKDCQTAKQPSKYAPDCEIRDHVTDHVAVCYLLHQRVIGQSYTLLRYCELACCQVFHLRVWSTLSRLVVRQSSENVLYYCLSILHSTISRCSNASHQFAVLLQTPVCYFLCSLIVLLPLLMIVVLFVLDRMRPRSFSLGKHKETIDTPGNNLYTLHPQPEIHTGA